jgi:hypothetical protein
MLRRNRSSQVARHYGDLHNQRDAARAEHRHRPRGYSALISWSARRQRRSRRSAVLRPLVRGHCPGAADLELKAIRDYAEDVDDGRGICRFRERGGAVGITLVPWVEPR